MLDKILYVFGIPIFLLLYLPITLIATIFENSPENFEVLK